MASGMRLRITGFYSLAKLHQSVEVSPNDCEQGFVFTGCTS
ncbi:hypothetical protein TRKP33_p0268 (plasmid) [Klebsiella pneumoniae]|nr:hypothetical protein [Klebsiella pneumoniae]BBE58826.1 hypothetical protein TRKP33_p0268 [Klebsiella pneumoniae]